MTVFSLLLFIVITVLLGAAAVWIMGQLAPSHPGYIDTIVWVVVVIVVIVMTLQAFGLLSGGGPLVPRFGRG